MELACVKTACVALARLGRVGERELRVGPTLYKCKVGTSTCTLRVFDSSLEFKVPPEWGPGPNFNLFQVFSEYLKKETGEFRVEMGGGSSLLFQVTCTPLISSLYFCTFSFLATGLAPFTSWWDVSLGSSGSPSQLAGLSPAMF